MKDTVALSHFRVSELFWNKSTVPAPAQVCVTRPWGQSLPAASRSWTPMHVGGYTGWSNEVESNYQSKLAKCVGGYVLHEDECIWSQPTTQCFVCRIGFIAFFGTEGISSWAAVPWMTYLLFSQSWYSSGRTIVLSTPTFRSSKQTLKLPIPIASP